MQIKELKHEHFCHSVKTVFLKMHHICFKYCCTCLLTGIISWASKEEPFSTCLLHEYYKPGQCKKEPLLHLPSPWLPPRAQARPGWVADHISQVHCCWETLFYNCFLFVCFLCVTFHRITITEKKTQIICLFAFRRIQTLTHL